MKMATIDKDGHVYQVRIHRDNPTYYQSANETRVGNRRSAETITKGINSHNASRAAYGYPPDQLFTVERAKVGEFEDVTAEFEIQLPPEVPLD
jgi:hypothetical protein